MQADWCITSFKNIGVPAPKPPSVFWWSFYIKIQIKFINHNNIFNSYKMLHLFVCSPHQIHNQNSCPDNPGNGIVRTFYTWYPILWPPLYKSFSMIYYWWTNEYPAFDSHVNSNRPLNFDYLFSIVHHWSNWL